VVAESQAMKALLNETFGRGDYGVVEMYSEKIESRFVACFFICGLVMSKIGLF
jgi:hypothetical protein